MKKHFNSSGILLSLSFAAVLLTGCGSDIIEEAVSETTERIKENINTTISSVAENAGQDTEDFKDLIGVGYYKDSGIEGIGFTCGKALGVTETDGKFIFEKGAEKCVFSFGDVIVKEVSGDILKDGVVIWEENKYVGQMLQSLDEDRNPDNGIQVSRETAKTVSGLDLDFFPKTELAFELSKDMFERIGIDITNADIAMGHMLNSRLSDTTVYYEDEEGVISFAFTKDMESVHVTDASGYAESMPVTIIGDVMTVGEYELTAINITEEGILVKNNRDESINFISFKKPEPVIPDTPKVFELKKSHPPLTGQISYIMAISEDPSTLERTAKSGVMSFGAEHEYTIAFEDGTDCTGYWDIDDLTPIDNNETGTCSTYLHDRLIFPTGINGNMTIPHVHANVTSTSLEEYIVFSGFIKTELPHESIFFGLFANEDIADSSKKSLMKEAAVVSDMNGTEVFKDLDSLSHYGTYIYLPPANFENGIPVVFKYYAAENKNIVGIGYLADPAVQMNRVMLDPRTVNFGRYSRFYFDESTVNSVEAALANSSIKNISVTGFNGSLKYTQADNTGKLFWDYDAAVKAMKARGYKQYLFDMVQSQYYKYAR